MSWVLVGHRRGLEQLAAFYQDFGGALFEVASHILLTGYYNYLAIWNYSSTDAKGPTH